VSVGREWWRDAVFYEIYVRSFADSNGDGVGDLPGVTQRLDYVRDLGVDAIWLTPFYPSPGADHGYDVSDYDDVDPLFGTLADFDELTARAHELGLHVIVDIVPNHTSNEHPWFAGDRSRYVTVPAAGGIPNNWQSNFGGSAWTLDEERGHYYLHLFAPEQPDLDWFDPQVRADFEEILRFWLDRGVDGFRIDVAHGLVKDPSLADEPERPREDFASDWRTATDRPEVHDVYRGWRRVVDAYDGDRVLVGEVVLAEQSRVAPYLRPDELQLAFNFSLVFQPWDADRLRASIDESLAALPVVTWVLENHDVQRIVTRFGGEREARAAALLLLALPGPVFLYQGQELGLEEVDLPDELRQDPQFERTGGEKKGRDGCRVPLPWTRGLQAHTWLPQPESWSAKSVEAQSADAGSFLALYRRALALRPRGGFAWRGSPPGSLVFERDETVCAVNVSAEPFALEGDVLLASEPLGDALPPGAAAWLRAPGVEH
jgi:alpha-glucosidase